MYLVAGKPVKHLLAEIQGEGAALESGITLEAGDARGVAD